ncbi:hypothetical protein GIB67_027832 [Kingdonia uniflora]|uniref:Exo-beta-D-glucosaminidase Ig-fold domain-containing protein n=1 Tax=Kingdonia uniflora TaxID=39325 RepID=A0A7J7P4L4_9MAGN|nr:hypothetical protein GIB67_027832 [Kingdonia uniflora]
MWDKFANGKRNFTDGPYNIQNSKDFIKENFYNYGFNPEVGFVGFSVAATIRATMPQEEWKILIFKKPSDGYVEEVSNPAKDLDDLCEKEHLVNYIQYRALLKGWTSWMWTKCTGILIWKTQNPWTGLRGGDGVNFVETNGTDSGVAFFLHFLVYTTKKDKQEGKDTRILPVHYSDNYFSLVPGETTTINSFEICSPTGDYENYDEGSVNSVLITNPEPPVLEEMVKDTY